MDIKAFRIEGFRSIKRTEWLPFSVDGITALVGQNESGKSSILDALSLGFSVKPNIQRNDFRSDTGLPLVALSLKLNNDEIEKIFPNFDDEVSSSIKKVLVAKECIEFISRIEEGASNSLVRVKSLADDLTKEITDLIPKLLVPESAAVDGGVSQVGTPSIEIRKTLSLDHIIKSLWSEIPSFVLFNESSCYLPDVIDVTNERLDQGAGYRGASNFLSAAGVTLPQLLKSDDRALATLVKRANTKVTKELQNFWSQVLGKKGKITIEFELRHHPASKAEKSGMPYILFWLSEGDGERLHPSQRSKGTRWFISFFLQLVSSQIEDEYIAFLLDEPGAFLHASAQADVLSLLERLDNLRPIIYSTHSPYLIDQKKIYRILAVERVDDEEGSETIVRRGLELAASSHITLAPILAAMGINFSEQSVIKRNGNVLLEESSAYYYLAAFCHLINKGAGLSFVACGGVDAVRVVVDLMTAWGINYMLLVDDDKQGKTVCRDIKNKYGFSDEEARNRLATLDGYQSIEDIFDPVFFRSHIAVGHNLSTDQTNSEAVKDKRISKPMLAVNFFQNVRSGNVTLNDIDGGTLDRFSNFISRAEAFFTP